MSHKTGNDAQYLESRIENAKERLKDCDDRIQYQKRKNLALGAYLKVRKKALDRFRRQETDLRGEVEASAKHVDAVPRCERAAAIYQAHLDQLLTIQDKAAANRRELADLRQQAISYGRATDDLAEERSRLKTELRALQKEMTEKHAPDTS